jgi:hypothetical protein
MADEIVTNTVSMVYYGQKAQTSRTNFTPGTTNGRANDMNWPMDFAVPVAGWAGGTDWTFKRTALVDRGIVSGSKPKDDDNVLSEEQNDKQDWGIPEL